MMGSRWTASFTIELHIRFSFLPRNALGICLREVCREYRRRWFIRRMGQIRVQFPVDFIVILMQVYAVMPA